MSALIVILAPLIQIAIGAAIAAIAHSAVKGGGVKLPVVPLRPGSQASLSTIVAALPVPKNLHLTSASISALAMAAFFFSTGQYPAGVLASIGALTAFGVHSALLDAVAQIAKTAAAQAAPATPAAAASNVISASKAPFPFDPKDFPYGRTVTKPPLKIAEIPPEAPAEGSEEKA